MADLLIPLVGVLVIVVGVYLLGRSQVRQYRGYLAEHVAETQRQTEAQRELIDRQVAAIDRQTEVLARIAETLERRA